MPPGFDVHVTSGIVVLTVRGMLQFEETGEALAAAANAAQRAHSRNALFDLRLADLSNYYSYSVRLAETAPQLGLDLSSFKLAFVGALRAADILSFTKFYINATFNWLIGLIGTLALLLTALKSSPRESDCAISPCTSRSVRGR